MTENIIRSWQKAQDLTDEQVISLLSWFCDEHVINAENRLRLFLSQEAKLQNPQSANSCLSDHIDNDCDKIW